VLGAAGGVGLAAIEIGKALGARVIACASSEDKLAVCRSHGADCPTISGSSRQPRQARNAAPPRPMLPTSTPQAQADLFRKETQCPRP